MEPIPTSSVVGAKQEVAVRRNRVLASFAVAAAASVAFAAPALAYPPGSSSYASLSDTSVARGETVVGQDSGNQPGEQVNGYVHSVRVFVGSTTANANGVATLTFTVPRSLAVGRHTFQLVGQSSGHVGSVGFTVNASGVTAPASNGSGLPFTGGNDIWQMTAAGAALILAGGALLVVRRRRTHSGLAA
jgi:LPXTG-motif cell wall-anchored protein